MLFSLIFTPDRKIYTKWYNCLNLIDTKNYRIGTFEFDFDLVGTDRNIFNKVNITN